MGRLHFVGGEKGGVGKSFCARLLAQYCIDAQGQLIGFDSDASHATFSRFYGDFTSPIIIDDVESLDSILNIAEQQPNANIVVDLAAQTAKHLFRWIEEVNLFPLMQELGFKTTFWHVMDDGADSMHMLKHLLKTIEEPSLQLVVVQNLGRAKDFSLFEQTPTYDQAKVRGAKFIHLTALPESLVQKIDFNDLSFWAAANNKQLMSTVERHRINTWLSMSYRKIHALLDEASDIPQPGGQRVQPVNIAQHQ